jgi:hypothetical protein
MMAKLPVLKAIGVGLLLVAMAPVSAELQDSKSALETDPTGWIDLLAKKDLQDWKRVPIPPGTKLSERNPWSLDTSSGMLICDGAGIHEMLLYNEEFTDGIFHVEWRFKKIEGKKGYNSGVYVRNSADGKVWHQAQVGNMNVGYIFGDTLIGGKLQRVRFDKKLPQRGKDAGEWNTYEVACKDKKMTLWINGAITAEWDSCEVPNGYVGLEAEGWYIEFSNVKFKR